jgi:hypothetical protein
MRMLGKIEGRLFTYKVAHDGGVAPNPYFGICSLAICKPAIRRVAKCGDVVVGFGCGADERRVVYCMVVDHVLTWGSYIEACHGRTSLAGVSSAALKKRIPKGEKDPGDCIWRSSECYMDALRSWSTHHGPDDFDHDVRSGKNVLLSKRYWYFGGGGDGSEVLLPISGELDEIIPGRGHRSNANNDHRESFVRFFNEKLEEGGFKGFGIHGQPDHRCESSRHEDRRRCREVEREYDAMGEEDVMPYGRG